MALPAKMTKERAEIFLQLYKKYLLLQYNEMMIALKTLPTNVIERCFDGVIFYEEGFNISKIAETPFGFNGLCGYGKISELGNELTFCKELDRNGTLEEKLKKVGFKVNRKHIGVAFNETEI